MKNEIKDTPVCLNNEKGIWDNLYDLKVLYSELDEKYSELYMANTEILYKQIQQEKRIKELEARLNPNIHRSNRSK